MMLPQFGFIVAQAGADSHTLPKLPPPPPSSSSNNPNNGSASSLAPLLHSKPFHFGHSSNSTTLPSAEGNYYPNNYTNHHATLPYYSRQPSPPPSQHLIQPSMLPLPTPPSLQSVQQPQVTPFLYNNSGTVKEKGFTSFLENKKKKESTSPWYRYQQPPIQDSPYYNHPQQQRHTTPPIDLVESDTNHKWHESTPHPRQEVKEYNDLMTWMDNEFWEQADEIYQEKLINLQNELAHLQKGTHSVFREMIADYELEREKTIKDAECFMKYEISFIEQCFDQDISALEDEYETERRLIQDTLITSIEDKRRQIKDDTDENNDNEESNHQSQSNSVRSKRNLRKRNADPATLRAEPLSKRRAVRPSTLPNIHTISPTEDEELENEYLIMKKTTRSQHHLY